MDIYIKTNIKELKNDFKFSASAAETIHMELIFLISRVLLTEVYIFLVIIYAYTCVLFLSYCLHYFTHV
uniref:Uncharacterized protein n=1 Tax=Heterorhabditis bacteriophora TaxID=37862 RepID=A0A1I7WAA2_HETBA